MKKIIALLLTVVLTATVAIGGTVAYLQDSARNDNTMTVGKVDISQWEYQRAKNENGEYQTGTYDNQNSFVLEGFKQDKMLVPATEINADGTPNNYGAGGFVATIVRMSQVGSYGSMEFFTTPNALDKLVVVKNDGNIGAHVRTIVAIEVGTGSAGLIGTSSRCTEDAADAGESFPWFKNDVGIVPIDSVNYYVYEYVYEGAKLSNGTYRHADGVLPANDMTYPSLAQVFLHSDVTNDDVTKLDGNSNGKLDILVLSQGVQAGGWTAASGKTVAQTALDTAFGEADATNVAEWFEQ